MGNGEEDTPSKTQKSSSTQEQPPPSSPATVYPDWASFQAYYTAGGTTPIPPPGFFHSPMASTPPGHPYMWGPQIIPPYGTPPAYVAMYPPGLYPHPSVPPGSHPYSPYTMASPNGTAEASVAGATGAEPNGKSIEGKERSPMKRSIGSLGSLNMLTGKGNETGKTSGASANSAHSQSGDSGSEGSSEGSDANSQNGSQQKQGHEHGSGNEETQKGSTTGSTSQVVPPPIVLNNTMPLVAIPPGGLTGPTTTLNIGMDYWGGPAPISAIRGKLPAAPSTSAMVPSSLTGSHDGVPSDLWLQDERELKRQRRKQSNRESARRSRLRKQAECEELGRRVGAMEEENDSLREELERIREENEKLKSENASLNEKLKEAKGEESNVDDVDKVNPANGDS